MKVRDGINAHTSGIWCRGQGWERNEAGLSFLNESPVEVVSDGIKDLVLWPVDVLFFFSITNGCEDSVTVPLYISLSILVRGRISLFPESSPGFGELTFLWAAGWGLGWFFSRGSSSPRVWTMRSSAPGNLPLCSKTQQPTPKLFFLLLKGHGFWECLVLLRFVLYQFTSKVQKLEKCYLYCWESMLWRRTFCWL